MIGMRMKGLSFNAAAVMQPAQRAARRVFPQQGAYVRGIAKRSIRRRANRRKSSPPGRPPYTHTGAIKRAVLFAAGADDVLIGPSASVIGRIGHTHEFGGIEPAQKRKPQRRYPPRPFMGPALAVAWPRLPGFWRDSIRRSA